VQQAQAGRDIYAANELHIHRGVKESFSPRHQLPPPPANFTGRDDELADFEKRLAADQAVCATISGKHAGLQGMGGVGKTALATILAHRLKDRYPDAQLYLNLRGADPDHRKPVTPGEAMQSIIHTFHPEAKLPDEPDALAPIYRSVLTDAGRVLLFLDNAAGADQVRPLLPPGNCLLIVTSRTQFTLPGLATRNIDCLQPEKSQELLLKLAPRIKGHEQDAAELCGHLPLALEVFAGAVNDKKLYPVQELLERLRTRQEKLDPVDAAFQVSYELLGDELQKCWKLLAVFSASFDLRAAAAVWSSGFSWSGPPEGGIPNIPDSARDAMQTLVNASLVEYNETNQRFRLHDLVRQFCDGKLNKAERTTARLRHARNFHDVGKETHQLYMKGGESMLRGLELFDRERAHIEAAFEWLQTRTDEESSRLLLFLGNTVAYMGDLRFHPRQRIRWSEAQRDAARRAKYREAEAVALGNLGNAYADLSETRRAIEFFEQVIGIYRELDDRRGEANALGSLGVTYANLGETRKAMKFYEQALVIHRELGDRSAEGADLGNLGIAYKHLGEARKAIEFYEQQLKIVRGIGDRRGEGTVLGNLGVSYSNLGETRKAMKFYEEALLIDRELGDRSAQGADLGNLGNAYGTLGETRKAIEFHEQFLSIAREIGNRRWEGYALWNFAVTLDKLGDREQAIARAEAALKIYAAIQDPNAAKVRAQLAKWRGK
jgi:tetratricopeptide (TPR) repeat protein